MPLEALWFRRKTAPQSAPRSASGPSPAQPDRYACRRVACDVEHASLDCPGGWIRRRIEGRRRRECDCAQQDIVLLQRGVDGSGEDPAQPQRVDVIGRADRRTQDETIEDHSIERAWPGSQLRLMQRVHLGGHDHARAGGEQLLLRQLDVFHTGARFAQDTDRVVDPVQHVARQVRMVRKKVSRHADAQAAHALVELRAKVGHRAICTGRIEGIVTGHHLERDCCVLDRARQRAATVERPGQGENTASRHQSIRWLQADDTTPRGRAADRAPPCTTRLRRAHSPPRRQQPVLTTIHRECAADSTDCVRAETADRSSARRTRTHAWPICR